MTRVDTYKVNNSHWQSAQDLPHNTIRIDKILVKSLVNEPVIMVKVIDIRAVNTDLLTIDDFARLDYADRDEYLQGWERYSVIVFG
ncbi:MAG: hypothetical protein ABI947_26745 [Chloroflexota bacterium]